MLTLFRTSASTSALIAHKLFRGCSKFRCVTLTSLNLKTSSRGLHVWDRNLTSHHVRNLDATSCGTRPVEVLIADSLTQTPGFLRPAMIRLHLSNIPRSTNAFLNSRPHRITSLTCISAPGRPSIENSSRLMPWRTAIQELISQLTRPVVYAGWKGWRSIETARACNMYIIYLTAAGHSGSNYLRSIDCKCLAGA
jgi:hypothetical protein